MTRLLLLTIKKKNEEKKVKFDEKRQKWHFLLFYSKFLVFFRMYDVPHIDSLLTYNYNIYLIVLILYVHKYQLKMELLV